MTAEEYQLRQALKRLEKWQKALEWMKTREDVPKDGANVPKDGTNFTLIGKSKRVF